jgi:hypothetical protein
VIAQWIEGARPARRATQQSIGLRSQGSWVRSPPAAPLSDILGKISTDFGEVSSKSHPVQGTADSKIFLLKMMLLITGLTLN